MLTLRRRRAREVRRRHDGRRPAQPRALPRADRARARAAGRRRPARAGPAGGRGAGARPDRHRRGRLRRGRLTGDGRRARRAARAAARASSGGASRSATGRRSSTSTSGSSTTTGRAIPEIFAEDGEAAFRALERAAVAALGPADPDADVRRVDRDRRRRGRRPAQPLGAVPRPRARSGSTAARGPRPAPAPLARTSGRSSPGRDPIGTIRDLAARRERFYAAATIRSHRRRRGPRRSSTPSTSGSPR